MSKIWFAISLVGLLACGAGESDSGATGNDGTYQGATPGSPGAIGDDTAVSFDGSNDYVEIPHDDSYLLDDGTIQLWFNTNSTTSGRLFSKDSHGQGELGQTY